MRSWWIAPLTVVGRARPRGEGEQPAGRGLDLRVDVWLRRRHELELRIGVVELDQLLRVGAAAVADRRMRPRGQLARPQPAGQQVAGPDAGREQLGVEALQGGQAQLGQGLLDQLGQAVRVVRLAGQLP